MHEKQKCIEGKEKQFKLIACLTHASRKADTNAKKRKTGYGEPTDVGLSPATTATLSKAMGIVYSRMLG